MGDSDRGRNWRSVTGTRRLRSSLGRLEDWVLLDGNRYVVATGIVAVGFGLFAWLGYRGIPDIGRSTTPMLYLFSALAGGNITLITIVVTINQLILSRELRSPREVQMELESAEEYREDVEDGTGRRGVPEQPDEFLHVLVAETKRQVSLLGATVDRDGGGDGVGGGDRDRDGDGDGDGEGDESATAEVDGELASLTTSLDDELAETLRRLETSHDDMFSALSTVLDADFGTRLNHSRWIRQSFERQLSESQRAILEELEEHVEQLDVARQYFKTIYIKQELADVSMLVMYTGLVATFVAIGFLMVVGYADTAPGIASRLVIVPLAVAVNLVPLALLVSHVVRITTVARRTAAITPFVSPTG